VRNAPIVEVIPKLQEELATSKLPLTSHSLQVWVMDVEKGPGFQTSQEQWLLC